MAVGLIDINSRRANDAKLYKQIGRTGFIVLTLISCAVIFLAFVCLFSKNQKIGFILLSLGFLFSLPAIWWKKYLSILPARSGNITDRLSRDALSCLKNSDYKEDTSYIWEKISTSWQTNFILHHLLLSDKLVQPLIIKGGVNELKQVLDKAMDIADKNNHNTIEVGYIAAGLLYISPEVKKTLEMTKSSIDEVLEIANWLARYLVEDENRKKQSFGGIGRDWTFGFTPMLDRFGVNLSLEIKKNGANYGWLTESKNVKDMVSSFNNTQVAIALIGPVGIGKTETVHAFAQRLIEGKTNRNLAYHEIIGISATDLISSANSSGSLESLIIALTNEASKAGHIILFFDDAELFLQNGPGAVDTSKILQTIIQRTSIPIILTLDPKSFELLKSSNSSLYALLTPIVMQEMDQNSVMRVLEDTAMGLEAKNQVLITYSAIKTAYSLSDRFEQDMAYPGKAIKLLEQAISHADNSLVTNKSVEQVIEQTTGVKTSSAGPIEADKLLNLENIIHERMINQVQAVKAVSGALRRSRAGVTNNNRPIGSFLFLGPTGVGKTELAKSLSASYFQSESNMIRLDMSEYQNTEDVERLLSEGKDKYSSLILAVRTQPFSVVLLDEIEKAHPNILNLLLQLLDEGQLTDTNGRKVSFKDAIIIATSNAGANTIRDNVAKGIDLNKFKQQLIDDLIHQNTFKPELINRFDEIVLFRPLNQDELVQVVNLMMASVNETLKSQNISVNLSQDAITKIVELGYDPTLGARPMRRVLQKTVEDLVAEKILKGEAKPGQSINLTAEDIRS